MPPLQINQALVARLYRRAKASRWSLPLADFSAALEASARRVFTGEVDQTALDRYLASLHLEDLALACACGLGHDAAWEHFVREQRPGLRRAADQIDPTGGAREIADALHAELYGLREREGRRESLFRHFHGRSSLATWLRAVLAQRHVDRMRVQSRTESLSDDDTLAGAAMRSGGADPDRRRHLSLVRQALGRAVGRLQPRDRLRLGCYYVQELTLAEIGRALHEHEATASRQLAKARRAIRDDVEGELREAGLGEAEIVECLSTIMEDPGEIDLGQMLEAADERKESAPRRSVQRTL